ncbi:septal junction protein FraD [Calothrix sp. PCC 6303]|uniref:septal junction protein FraD n=1 Tax=Calothrix sp. PCC 6303 TaxID=1170562 RepID=UPI0002A0357D|nr:septal junction protein FraD [Calothrix sp. PCC 6303]AFZ04419.1 hypothetical protein Cal6303_5539 [Calothrix sp. PCC 6303]
MALVKDFFGVFKIVEDVYEQVKKILVPKQAYSWQTLIYLSLFSWLMSSLALGTARDLIAFCGWVFLIAGTSWYTTDKPILVPGTNLPVGALITGFLVSAFAVRSENVFTPRTLVLWPTISAIITAIPEFFEGSGIDYKRQLPKLEIRQRIIILLAVCMVISCWLQLYFTIDKWARQYPSILADDFSKSTLIVPTEPKLTVPASGAIILNRIQPIVEGQLRGRSWNKQSNNDVDVERWLIEANQRVASIGQDIMNRYAAEYERKNLVNYEERVFWSTEARVVNTKSTNSGYRLDLLSVWKGPSSNTKKYFLRKSCQIDPISKPADNSTVNTRNPGERVIVAEIQCEAVPKFFAGSPPVKQ